MVDLDELPTADKVVAGAGIVAIVDLVFLPWHSFAVGPVTLAWSAIEGRNTALGMLAVVLTIAVVGVTLLRAMRPHAMLPEPALGWDRTVLLASALALALLVLKLAADTERLGLGAWLGVGLAAAMTVGAALPLVRAAADVAE